MDWRGISRPASVCDYSLTCRDGICERAHDHDRACGHEYDHGHGILHGHEIGETWMTQCEYDWRVALRLRAFQSDAVLWMPSVQ